MCLTDPKLIRFGSSILRSLSDLFSIESVVLPDLPRFSLSNVSYLIEFKLLSNSSFLSLFCVVDLTILEEEECVVKCLNFGESSESLDNYLFLVTGELTMYISLRMFSFYHFK
jgi:hypothetical protein